MPANKHFLEGLQKICNREGITFIIDEVQSGFGRCGSYFAIEKIAPGLQPDIMVMAKGIANVSPIRAVRIMLKLQLCSGLPSFGHCHSQRVVRQTAAW